MKVFKLININILLLIAFTQFVFRFGFIERQANVFPALNHWQYLLLILSCMLIGAGGFFINNVIGKNQNNISEGKGYNIYMVITIIALGIGYYIANFTGRPAFVGIFIVGAATLYMYASSMRQTLLLGNVLIAFTAALILVVPGLFDLYPILSPYTQSKLGVLFSVMLDYSIFTFVIVFIYTLVKDLADTDTDYNAGLNTLPIVMGRDRAARIVFFLALLPLVMVLYYGNRYLTSLLWALGYILLCVAGPLIYFIIRMWSAKTQKDFKHLLIVLKLVFFFAAASIAVITFNMNYNA